MISNGSEKFCGPSEGVCGDGNINGFTVRELKLEDLRPDLLKGFERYQKVRRFWRRIDGEWGIEETDFIERWDDALKTEIVTQGFGDCIRSGGTVLAFFGPDGEIAAFANMPPDFLGSRGQYLQLAQLHVSHPFRNRGLGKKLFGMCAERARSAGAEKLYISTHSAEESQAFYRGVGCRDAEEIVAYLAEKEPFDRQMEYVL